MVARVVCVTGRGVASPRVHVAEGDDWRVHCTLAANLRERSVTRALRLPIIAASIGFAAILTAAPHARAVDPIASEGGDIQRFTPATTATGGFSVPTSDVLLPGAFSVGGHLNYANNPLVLLRNGVRVAGTVENNLTLHLQGAYGLFDWLELGAAAGFVAFQNSTDTRLVPLQAFAPTDLRLAPKFLVLQQWRDGISLSVTPHVTVPLGGAQALVGDAFLTVMPEVGVSRRWSGFALAGSALLRVRRDAEVLDGIRVGSEALLRAAAAFRVHEQVETIVEGEGGLYLVNAGAVRNHTLELRGGARWRFHPEWSLDGALGLGILSGPGTPDARVVVGATYGPGIQPRGNEVCTMPASYDGKKARRAFGTDKDSDGFDDACDLCPTEAESRDGWLDDDGCPENDRDRDGIKDAIDACPDVPGIAPHGCPDTDGDGVLDSEDGCLTTPGPAPLGCPDTDGDGLVDRDDRCPTVAGPAPHGCPDADGDGLADPDDRCVNEPEDKDDFDDLDGCPDLDDDKDGVPDTSDACRREPEDKDTYQDTDGCPDPDNDTDGVPDLVDACPLEPAPSTLDGCPIRDRDADTVPDASDNCPDEAGPQTNQGCPETKKQLVVIKKGKIEILDTVYFAVGKDVILPVSFALLDNVATVVNDHPEIPRVRVEGHTDNQGKDAANLDLSARRARAVVKYLVTKGVAAARLEAQGFGPSRPIADNKTVEGRAKNRRVEFSVVGAEGIGKSDNGPPAETLEKPAGSRP